MGNEPFTLISTKLNKPRVASDLVERPRLVGQLNKGLERKLTLVSAPAGYGKTTLVVEWFAREKPGAMARKPQIWPRVIAAALIAALALWGGSLYAVLLVVLLALVMFVLILLDVRQRRRSSAEDNLSPHLSVSSP